ncbi:MAG: ATP-binding protein, partial [Hyphomicrobium sp.]
MIDQVTFASRVKFSAERTALKLRQIFALLPALPQPAPSLRQSFNDLIEQPDAPHTGPSLEHVKDASWQLAENEVRFRELVDSQDELIIRRDCDSRVIFANRAYCEAFAVDLHLVRGRRFSPAVMATEVYAAGRDSQHQVAELIETAKGQRWILWEEQRIATAGGPPDNQYIGRDVTDERRAAIELRDARDQAQAANRAKSRFLAAMSHEIRTPMNGILGMAGLLEQTPQSEEQRCYTRAIDQSARALLALIDEILDFSKIEAGKLKLMPEAFSLRECVASAVELLEHKAADKGLRLTCAIAPDVADVVMGDHARVRQIVLNLVSNAVKFTERGSVDVVVRQHADALSASASPLYEIIVKDTGIGFSPKTLKLLFDEFEQADGTAGRRQDGTGLGLAISKRLARAMGGDIMAEGAIGAGATFTATVRLGTVASGTVTAYRPAAALCLNANQEPPITLPQNVSQPRILIVEDNEINALLTRRVSERAGC